MTEKALPETTRIPVRLAASARDRSYEIVVGEGILGRVGPEAARLGLGDAVFLISSPRVLGLHGEAVLRSFSSAGFAETKAETFPDGEDQKNFRNYEDLLRRLAAFDDGERRRVFVACLGGGVVGDLGGFVAATFRRGVPCIQIPTTLLALADSGVGGKVGIDLLAKNQVGAFHQPSLVVADVACLRTLPPEEIRSGLGEVIKHGVIADPDLFAFLEGNLDRILRLEGEAVRRIVVRSYEIKARIVEADEFDRTGARASLNFGHTFGHAIEAAAGYRGLRHGECVAIGMCCAADLAVALGLFPTDEARRLDRLVAAAGLPARWRGLSVEAILGFMRHDKKFVAGKNRFVLPIRIGEVALREGIPPDLVRRAVEGRKG